MGILAVQQLQVGLLLLASKSCTHTDMDSSWLTGKYVSAELLCNASYSYLVIGGICGVNIVSQEGIQMMLTRALLLTTHW